MAQQTPHDDYWMPETPYLFNGVFSYYHAEPRRVVGQVHLSEERYDLSEKDALIRTVAGRGVCIYVHIRPGVEERPLFLTVAPESSPASPGQVGRVIGRRWGDPQLRAVGNVQGWYYPSARVFCLWDAFLERDALGGELIIDFNMHALWKGILAWVRVTFPGCERVSTLFRHQFFPTDQYQAFLRAIGFEPVAQAAFGMSLEINDDPYSFSQCLRCGEQFDGEWCPRCDVREALRYERSTPDGTYRARCACQSGSTGNAWVFWTLSPSHLPGSGTRCQTFEEARAAVDAYLDKQVPDMQRE